VVKEFDQLTSSLSGINSGLTKKKLAPIQPLIQSEWDKMHAEGAGGGPSGATRPAWERD